MKVKEAKKITEGFTKTSKMPGLSYSPASLGMQNRVEAPAGEGLSLRQLLRSEG
jgi:hypothetical protein